MNAQELREKLKSRWWRLNNLYYILDKHGNEVLFRPNLAQAEYLKNRHYLNCNLKARQLGFSTAIQIDMLDRCLFNTNWNAGIIAQDKDTAHDIFENKVKFAFERLPAGLQKKFAPQQDSARKMRFANGSSITVGTSLRGGTLQQLHVSELGKIAAKYPSKAREIRTGAFNTLAEGQLIDVESTAEGRSGEFYERVQISRRHTDKANAENRDLRPMEWRFHFFAWWQDPQYTTDPKGVAITERLQRYFDETLRDKYGIELTAGQKAWYALKLEDQGDEDMKREYPSFPDEAFDVAVQGAYFASQMALIRRKGQIRKVPYDPRLPVFTFWDLGRNDNTAIWFMQYAFGEFRMIRYYENSGESLQFYCRKLREFEYHYSTCYLPHDAEVTDFSSGDNMSRREIVEAMGFSVEVVPRCPDKREAIQAARDILPLCWFDEELCADGIIHLDNHRKKWNEQYGDWMDEPFRGPDKHAADALEQMARGFSIYDGGGRDSYEPEVA